MYISDTSRLYGLRFCQNYRSSSISVREDNWAIITSSLGKDFKRMRNLTVLLTIIISSLLLC